MSYRSFRKRYWFQHILYDIPHKRNTSQLLQWHLEICLRQINASENEITELKSYFVQMSAIIINEHDICIRKLCRCVNWIFAMVQVHRDACQQVMRQCHKAGNLLSIITRWSSFNIPITNKVAGHESDDLRWWSVTGRHGWFHFHRVASVFPSDWDIRIQRARDE